MNTEPGTEARALDLDQTDIQDISLEIKDDGEGYILLANKVQYESPPPTDGGGKGNYSRIDLTNFWSLCDVKLAEVAPACSKLREVVVEVRALEGAKFRDVKNRVQEEVPSATQDKDGPEYNDEEDQLDLEMGINELQELVTDLFPDSRGCGLVVRAEIGPVGRISGIWDRHDCRES
ncbi:hypothetical protein BDN72DRAFT_838824 [Pluteus cervinus]|uniref:Uncharacterized protein n=1 Tax=Pluteus cervinus TaxID=181527 RepID=A0ACD3AXZ8_9AGAR|nr:hypothetical protein BDN72DRAFT_838824 [Pluteus cervinus]